MTTTDALKQALTFIQFGWTQGAEARNGAGRTVRVSDESACCFSLDGALQRATWPHPFTHQSDAPWNAAEAAAYRLAKVAGMNGGGDFNPWAVIQEWNDERGRTKDEVEQLIREALTVEEE